MTDIAELVVAAAIAVAVDILAAMVFVLCVTLAPFLRGALEAAREAACRLGGYGFVGRARPRRKPPPRAPAAPLS